MAGSFVKAAGRHMVSGFKNRTPARFAGFILILIIGCQQGKPGVSVRNNKPPFVQDSNSTHCSRKLESKQSGESVPKISFDAKVYDFGELAAKEKGVAEFRFRNAGEDLLKIGKIRSTCGCTVPVLARKEYKPAEEGIIKVKYSGQRRAGAVSKKIYVETNDSNNPKVELVLKANIIQYVEAVPDKLLFFLNQENPKQPEVTLKSRDGTPFSVKNFASSGDVIKADFNPDIKANEFTLKLTPDNNKLEKHLVGRVKIAVDHPKCDTVIVPYDVPDRLRIEPEMIFLHRVKPNVPQIKEVRIKNIKGKNVEIESVNSKKGYVKLLSNQRSLDSIKLRLQITPPPNKKGMRLFTDSVSIKIKGGKELILNCNGFCQFPMFSN